MIDGLHSIQDIATYLKGRGERLSPMNAARIAYLQERFSCQFPSVYHQFLSLMGNGAGNYMKGSSAFSDELLSLKAGASELINEHALQPLPTDAFVFWMHQGYQAAYFLLNGSDDPPVYFFSETNDLKAFVLKEQTLTNFFIAQLAMSFED
jgi:SMI1-KNR4 cell-wall